jgi:hypothetical protein
MEFERSMQGSMGMNEPMREDSVTKSIEHYTSAIPSSAFLGVALGAIGIALVAQSAGRGKWGNFIAQWVPTLLILGVYNKLVKVEGHDQQDRGERAGGHAYGMAGAGHGMTT